jgi:hypothetical protein
MRAFLLLLSYRKLYLFAYKYGNDIERASKKKKMLYERYECKEENI